MFWILINEQQVISLYQLTIYYIEYRLAMMISAQKAATFNQVDIGWNVHPRKFNTDRGRGSPFPVCRPGGRTPCPAGEDVRVERGTPF